MSKGKYGKVESVSNQVQNRNFSKTGNMCTIIKKPRYLMYLVYKLYLVLHVQPQQREVEGGEIDFNIWIVRLDPEWADSG